MSNRWKIRDVEKLGRKLQHLTDGTSPVSGENPADQQGGGHTQGSYNLFDNSNFEIAQRGATQTGVTGPKVFGCDRWCTEAVNQALSSTVAHGLTTASIQGQPSEYVMKTEGTDTGYLTFGQMMDPGQNLIGKQLTISMDILVPTGSPTMSSSAAISFRVMSDSPYLRNGTLLATIAIPNDLVKNQWYSFSHTFTLPAYTAYTHLGVSIRDLSVTTAGSAFHFRKPQLVVGSDPLAWSRPSYQTEVDKCLYHFYRCENMTASNKRNLVLWRGDITNGGYYSNRIHWPRHMYKVPSITNSNFNYTATFDLPYWQNVGTDTGDIIARANSSSNGQYFEVAFDLEAEYFP